jgi:hypothetical protein
MLIYLLRKEKDINKVEGGKSKGRYGRSYLVALLD